MKFYFNGQQLAEQSTPHHIAKYFLNNSSASRAPSSETATDFALLFGSLMYPFSCSRFIVSQSNPFHAHILSRAKPPSSQSEKNRGMVTCFDHTMPFDAYVLARVNSRCLSASRVFRLYLALKDSAFFLKRVSFSRAFVHVFTPLLQKLIGAESV